MVSLIQSIAGIGCPRILVFGDAMLDRYTWGDAGRVSPEAPVIVLNADHEEIRPGGAASVAYLLRHLDAHVSIAGVVGNDPAGGTLRALLRDEGVDDRFLVVDPTRPSTVKHRLVGRAAGRHPHQILRVDYESREPLSGEVATRLGSEIEQSLEEFDAVLIADYMKGVCTSHLLRTILEGARAKGKPVLVDPARSSRYQDYRGATLLKPNRFEAEALCGRRIDSSDAALREASNLRNELELESVVITLDRDGLVVSTAATEQVIASDPRSVYDITGAGDMVLAMLGLCLAAGVAPAPAAQLANTAAGLEVERFGIAPVTRAEITRKLVGVVQTSAGKIVSAANLAELAEQYRQQGKRVVFTNGCFDLLHMGHVRYLQEAALLGDILLVAVNSDSSVRQLKGSSRPVISHENRAGLLSALSCVSHVVVFDELTPHALLKRIRPHVLVKGGTTPEIAGREIVESYGGEVRRMSTVEGFSTTHLIESISGRT